MNPSFALGLLTTLALLGALTMVHRARLKYGSNAFEGIRVHLTCLKTWIVNLQALKTNDGPLSEPPKPSLLGIPVELRDEIYRLALTSDEGIEFTKDYVEPGLLSTCCQVRYEATSILFFGNVWHIDLPDWDYSLFDAFMTSVCCRGIDPAELEVWLSNYGTLNNKASLLRCLKYLHDNEDTGLKYVPDHTNRVWTAATGAHDIVSRMAEQTWDVIESVLEVYFEEVANQNGDWDWQ